MNKVDGKNEFKNSNKKNRYEKDWRLELLALIGFCFSGGLFVASGIKNGDIYTIIGSSVWIISCVIWMIPFRKHFDTKRYKRK